MEAGLMKEDLVSEDLVHEVLIKGELVDKGFADFLLISKEDLHDQRQALRTKYNCLSAETRSYNKILLTTLNKLQTLKELNEDGVLILSKVLEESNLDEIKSTVKKAIDTFVSSLKNHNSIQGELYDYIFQHQNLNNTGELSDANHDDNASPDREEYDIKYTNFDEILQPELVLTEPDNKYYSVKEEDYINIKKEGRIKEEINIGDGLDLTVKLENDIEDNYQIDETMFFKEEINDVTKVKKKKLKGKVTKKKEKVVRDCELEKEIGEICDDTNNEKSKVTDSKTFKCEYCPHISQTKGRQDRHLAKHLPRDKSHTCDVCGKSFVAQHHLRFHMKGHEKVNHKELFNCKDCDKVFKMKCMYEDHLRQHTGERRYRCDQCGAGFMRNDGLKRHIAKSHLGELKHHCEYCQKGFYDKSTLVDHIRFHTGEKPFECDVCAKRFTIRRTLTEHKKCHSTVKPWKCKECGKAFNKKATLKQHMIVHSGIKIPCTFCSKEFARKDKLAEHKKRMHPDMDLLDDNKVNIPHL